MCSDDVYMSPSCVTVLFIIISVAYREINHVGGHLGYIYLNQLQCGPRVMKPHDSLRRQGLAILLTRQIILYIYCTHAVN